VGSLRDHRAFHDTYLISKVIRNDHPSHALKQLTWELGRFPRDDEGKISAYSKGGYQNVPREIMDVYQERDAQRCALLFRLWYPMLQKKPDWLYAYEVEKDLVTTTLNIEDRGVHIDTKRTAKLIKRLRRKLGDTLDEVEKITGDRLKPGTHSFRFALLERLMKSGARPELTPTGLLKTERSYLMDLRRRCKDPLLDLHVRYTSWEHALSILNGYLLLQKDGILHPTIRTCQAITGRQSCSEPNLQNVEKESSITNPYQVGARSLFTPEEGYVYLFADYSGQEVRLLVHYSGEEKLRKIIFSGGDVHRPACLVFYGDAYKRAEAMGKKHLKPLRDACKNASFALYYGAGREQVAECLGMSLDEYGGKHQAIRNVLPRISTFGYRVGAEVKDKGYVTTAWGRRLYVSRHESYRGANYLIQGTAAFQLKLAEIRLERLFQKETSGEAGIVLPIHDELMIRCPKKRLGDMLPILKKASELMVDFGDVFSVPFSTEWGITNTTWAEKRPLPLEDKGWMQTIKSLKASGSTE
jgi:DNA polymerase-1